LISDYFKIGGFSASVLNASLLALFSLLVMTLAKAPFDGMTLGTMSMMAGFGLFGKNVVNILPIVLGSYLFSRYSKEDYGQIVKTGLLASSFAPIITEIMFVIEIPFPLAITLSVLVGVSVGFLITPIARHLYHIHKGYSLYNVGFVIGIMSTLYVSMMKSLGFMSYQRLVLSSGHNTMIVAVLCGFFMLTFCYGFYENNFSFKGLKELFSETGYGNDFLKEFGWGTTLMNMSLNGLFALVYVLFLAKGDLTGPVVGAILVTYGFGAVAKHIRNIYPIFLGVYIGGLVGFWDVSSVGSIFAALFGSALAPLTGVFGPLMGAFAGFVNASVVLNIGFLHSGMNLYNTGFSVGIVAAVFVPVLEYFSGKKNQ